MIQLTTKSGLLSSYYLWWHQVIAMHQYLVREGYIQDATADKALGDLNFAWRSNSSRFLLYLRSFRSYACQLNMLLQRGYSTQNLAQLLIALLLVTNVATEDGKTEIALNVFSDIAPYVMWNGKPRSPARETPLLIWTLTITTSILGLFGEQFATQFASQSLTWLDHVLMAMVALGIITIISGAIRVAGPQWSRAVIGRARESRAVAEVELMSSDRMRCARCSMEST